MTRTTGIFSILISAAATLSGCTFDFDRGYWEEDVRYAEPVGYDASGTLEVEAVDLRGDLGTVRGFSGGIWLDEGDGWDGYSQVQIQSQSAGAWAVFVQVEVDAGFAALEPGQRYRFEGWGDGGYAGAPHVRVMGCSGPRPDDWSYDQYADSVDVVVQDSTRPGWIQVEVVAHFESWDEVGSGTTTQDMHTTFEVQVQ